MAALPKMKLLTVNNPKTAKGGKFGYVTGVLHLAPSDLSGYNVCPMAQRLSKILYGKEDAKGGKSACSLGCLNLAGRGGLTYGKALTVSEVFQGACSNTIQEARIRRTKMFFEDRDGFMALLVRDMMRLMAWGAQEGFKVAFRLNGTSDIDWSTVPVDVTVKLPRGRGEAWAFAPRHIKAANIFGAFPAVQFYDYTKVVTRAWPRPANYYVVLSLTESNDDNAEVALQQGLNVAVVLHVRKGERMPEVFTIKGVPYPVIDGDESDLRFLDPAGVIVGLRAKGPAMRDTTGFVRAV